MSSLDTALHARLLAIDKAILADARGTLVLLLEDLPASQPLYDQYKNFIQEYKVLQWPHQLEHLQNF